MRVCRGHTLIEMLVVLTTTSVLLAIPVGILALLFRTEQAGREHGQQAVVFQRLAAQFREDAHAAERWLPDQAGPQNQWQFALGAKRTASYRVVPGAVARDEAASGRTVRHESYSLPPGCTARAGFSADRSVAGLTVAPVGADAAWRRQLQIDAVLGRDRRFVRAQSGGH